MLILSLLLQFTLILVTINDLMELYLKVKRGMIPQDRWSAEIVVFFDPGVSMIVTRKTALSLYQFWCERNQLMNEISIDSRWSSHFGFGFWRGQPYPNYKTWNCPNEGIGKIGKSNFSSQNYLKCLPFLPNFPYFFSKMPKLGLEE